MRRPVRSMQVESQLTWHVQTTANYRQFLIQRRNLKILDHSISIQWSHKFNLKTLHFGRFPSKPKLDRCCWLGLSLFVCYAALRYSICSGCAVCFLNQPRQLLPPRGAGGAMLPPGPLEPVLAELAGPEQRRAAMVKNRAGVFRSVKSFSTDQLLNESLSVGVAVVVVVVDQHLLHPVLALPMLLPSFLSVSVCLSFSGIGHRSKTWTS